MPTAKVLIDGHWISSEGAATFHAINPRTGETLDEKFPVSPWFEVDKALHSADRAFQECRAWPGERFAAFMERYAERIEARSEELIAAAHAETALPVKPRLADAELPRTISQLKMAAHWAREGSWMRPTIDGKLNIRSTLAPIGPVAVFGPNNFPFAFNSIAGGDFAAAVAAGNPVIAKGHSSHPRTTQLFAEEAQAAADETHMPSGFVQLIYRTSHEDGAQLVSHPLLGAIGYTGGRHAGLYLKSAADAVGKPIYLELSSVNPVVFLPGALAERGEALATEYAASCLMGSGQFCTNPGVVFLISDSAADQFVANVVKAFTANAPQPMLGPGVQRSFLSGVETLSSLGAKLLCGGSAGPNPCTCENTLLQVSGQQFVANAAGFQTEIFGNGALFVMCENLSEISACLKSLEGNLTGAIYSASASTEDEAAYTQLAGILRQKVGRLLNDKMPTGVAVSPAMNHGGPFPATGHPGFTAVGLPASITRFAALHCFDNVRDDRLPPALQNQNPLALLRLQNGEWTRDPLTVQ